MSEPRRPRVVMMVANAFTHDTRVEKEARSLAEWGLEVHVVALAQPGLPPVEDRSGVTVHRVQTSGRYLPAVTVLACLWAGRLDRLRVRPPQADPAAPSLRPRPILARRIRQILSAPVRILRFTVRQLLYLRGHLRALLDRITPIRRLRRYVGARVRPYRPPAIRILAINRDFARAAAALRPDVVHCHDLNTLVAGLLVKEGWDVPLVYDSHELFLDRNIAGASRYLDRRLWGPIEAEAIGRCDAVISVSEGICRTLEDRYGIPRADLVRNVQRYELPPAGREHLLHRALGLEEKTRLGIYAGAIVPNRGIEIMIEAARHLRSTAFVVMGYAHSQDYLAQLREQATRAGVLGRTLFFHPAVPPSEVGRYAASADLGIVPTVNACLSYYFEASNKIFHCLMAGVPLAMSDHPEKRLLVERHGIGILFDETGEPAAVAAGVENLLDDPSRLAEMRAACLVAARTLNWEHEEHTLRTIYSRLLGSDAPPVPDVDAAALARSPGPDPDRGGSRLVAG